MAKHTPEEWAKACDRAEAVMQEAEDTVARKHTDPELERLIALGVMPMGPEVFFKLMRQAGL